RSVIPAGQLSGPQRHHGQRECREDEQGGEDGNARFHSASTTTSPGSNSTVISAGAFSMGGALITLSFSCPTWMTCSLVSPRKLDSTDRPVKRFLPLDPCEPFSTG